MKKRTEENELLAEVLAGAASEDFRTATLNRGLIAMRQGQARRRGWRVTCVLLLALAVMWVARTPQTTTIQVAHQPPPEAPRERFIEGTQIRILNDDELLAHFPGRPVALAGPPGAQRLLLLDEGTN